MVARSAHGAAVVPPVPLLCHFDMAASHYACYPTEDWFTSDFDAAAAARALRERGGEMAVGGSQPMSLDIRIPLDRPGYPRAPSPRHLRALRQIAALEDEIRLAADALGARQHVSELRLGGEGVATLGDAVIDSLLETLDDAFTFTRDLDLSIEVDPARVSVDRLSKLRALGFKRLAFDLRRPRAQRLSDAAYDLMRAARQVGVTTLVAHVAYGFPTLGPVELPPDVSAVAALRPDRILLQCARSTQSRATALRGMEFPVSFVRAQRAEARANAIRTLLSEGYVHVGMDQFALPTDPLAVARRQGRCHVDLDGVRERCEGDILGLGVAATSRIGHIYYRNSSKEATYRDALLQQRLPVDAGLMLSRDDLVRRTLIHALIANRRVDFESIELAHLIHVRQYFAGELGQISDLVRAGLADMDADGVELTAAGEYVACAVAMAFDRRLQRDVLPRS